MHARDFVLGRDGLGVIEMARRDRHWTKARLAVRDEMAIAHDEAGADTADAPVLAARQARQVVETHIEGHGGFPVFVWRLVGAMRTLNEDTDHFFRGARSAAHRIAFVIKRKKLSSSKSF